MTGRHELEIRQRALVAALVTGAEPPAGLDGERVRVMAAALVRKRGRAVARAHPELAAALGPGFGPAFSGYAASRPGPAPGCAAADAREFARYLLGSCDFDNSKKRARWGGFRDSDNSKKRGGASSWWPASWPARDRDVRRAARRVARGWPVSMLRKFW